MVEDHALMRSLVADAFRQRDFEVASAGSAQDALEQARAFDPDLQQHAGAQLAIRVRHFRADRDRAADRVHARIHRRDPTVERFARPRIAVHAHALAGLPAEQLREALRMRRTALAGGRR